MLMDGKMYDQGLRGVAAVPEQKRICFNFRACINTSLVPGSSKSDERWA